MAKSLLLKVLVDVLGKYVEGLKEENLKVGVWSGKIQFFNLKLKESALDELNLPIKVVRGSLKSLIVKIPWTQLESKPVEIFLEGIYALASPLDLAKFTEEDVRRLSKVAKQEKLSQLDSKIAASFNKSDNIQDTAKKASYFQQLVTHIVDNLEVNIKNIHVRYEDSVSDPNGVFALGITLDEISLSTTDEGWNIRYIKRNSDSPISGVIHKLGTLQHCGIYWNPKAVKSSDKPYDQWEEFMFTTIYKTDMNSAMSEFIYILHPENQLTLKLTHSGTATETTPNVDILIESSTIGFNFDRFQFQQIFLVANSFEELDKRKEWSLHRPTLRPNVDPRAWWYYAYRLIIGKDISFKNKMKIMMLCVRSKSRYIVLVKQQKMKEFKNDKLDTASENEMHAIEDRLPLCALTVFRETAVREALKDIEALKNQPKFFGSKSSGVTAKIEDKKQGSSEEPKKSSFFGGWFSSSSKKPVTDPTSPKKVVKEAVSEEDESEIMQSVESKFKKIDEASQSAVASSFAFRLRLASSSRLNVYYEKLPFAEMCMNLEASLEVRFTNVLIHCDFGNVSLLDQISKFPYNPQVVQMLTIPEKVSTPAISRQKASFIPQFGFDLSIIQNKVNVKVKSLPLLFTWNFEFLKNIVRFFTIEDNSSDKIGKKITENFTQSGEEFVHSNNNGSVVEVEIEVYAPKVVIPENPKYEERCIFADAGYLTMKGRMTSDGMKWNINLSNINIAMPLKKEEVLQIEGSHDYLIKPFDVNLILHNLDKSTADMCMDGIISPGVQAEFDAGKIIRLVQAILLIIDTFAEDKVDESSQIETKQNLSDLKHVGRRRSLIAIPDDLKSMIEKGEKVKGGKVVKSNPLKIKIELAGLECKLTISPDHCAFLKFNQLCFNFLDRPHDSVISFQMNAIDLLDSNRPLDFQSVVIARSAADTDTNNLVDVKYFMFKDKRSPIFNGFQSELQLLIADVDAYVDAFTTRSYQVFLKDIMENYRYCFQNAAASQAVARDVQNLDSKPKVKSSDLSGIRIQFLLNKVSCHILSRLNPSDPTLEIGFSFFANKLKANIEQLQLVSGEISLERIELCDSRSCSSKLFYKTLVSNSSGNNFPGSEDSNRLVDMRFYQDGPKTTIVEIKVRDLTTTISVGVIIDFIDLLMANINSFMGLLAQIKFDEVQSSEVVKATKQRKSSLGRNIQVNEADSVIVNVSVVNPNLILLEDPAIEHSKAIAATCSVTVQYLKESKTGSVNESKDVVHVSLQEAEIFVLLDKSVSEISHRIIEPTSLQFHMTSLLMSDVNVLLDLSISSEDIYIRASLNDVVLGSKIIQRLTERPNQAVTEMEGSSDKDSIQAKNNRSANIQSGLTMYKFRFNLSKVQVVLINDYNGQSNPLVRIDATDADVSFHGAVVDLHGEGSLVLVGDYYNSDLALWEPLIERWQPSLVYQQSTDGKELKIRYDSFVQINITTILIKCVYNALTMIERIGEEGTYCSRGNTHPLTIRNQLGLGIELFDAGSSKPLLCLETDTVTKIPHLSESSEQSRLAREQEFYRTFDLKLSGDCAANFLAIRDLRLDIHKPKIFQLQNPRGSVQKQSSSYAPVMEQVFQYSRYNVLRNSWESPWTKMGDPNEWADAQGKGGMHPTSITLPSGWEWLEPEWKVDLNGSIGKEIDKDGWEYALHFNSFGVNTSRRSKQAGDCVRRRKWTRTRYMKQEKRGNAEGFAGRIVWQVVSNPDETKLILLRSTKVVENRFSVGIEIGVESSFADGNCSKKFKVASNGETSFPLLLSEESAVRVRLQGLDCNWSDAFPLVLGKALRNDSSERKIYQCLCKSQRLISVGLMTVEKEGILKFVVSPLLEVTNYLPCDIQYKAQGMQEDLTILSGGKASAIFYQDSVDVLHFFRLGYHTASIPVKFPKKGANIDESLSFFSADRASALNLKMRLLTTNHGSRHIIIYSSLLVIDRTSLNATFINYSSREKAGIDWNNKVLGRQISSKGNLNAVDNESWIMGKNGLALFTPLERTFQVAFANGSAMIEDINPSSLSSSKISLDAINATGRRCYHVAFKSEPYPVAADLSTVVTLMPAFHVVNSTPKTIYMVQKDISFESNAVQSISPKYTAPFHGSNSKRETNLYFRVDGSDWSLGTVNINEIGTSAILLVNTDSYETSPFVYLNIDVRFSAVGENSYITVVIWESKIWKDPINDKVYREGSVVYSIRNDAEVPVVFIQRNVSVREKLKLLNRQITYDNDESKWAAIISPKSWQPFAFIDPEAGDEFTFFIGTSLRDTLGEPVSLKLSKIGQYVSLKSDHENIRLRIQVKSNANGKIITIQNCTTVDMTPEVQEVSKKSFQDLRQNDFVLSFSVASLGLSIIADKPTRRELFAIALKGIYCELRQVEETKQENAATLILFNLLDIEIDNYSESAVYPVLIRSLRGLTDESTGPSKKNEERQLQFVEFSTVIEYPKDQTAPIVRYLACRVLEVFVAIDSASILITASDLLSFISVSDEAFSLSNAENFNLAISRLLANDKLYDVELQYKASQNQKIFFENLVVHPMKFVLDFYPNHFPRNTREIPPVLRWLTVLESISAVENFQIRIKSFIAENAMESVPSLMKRIGNKILRDIQANLVQIAGGLIGSLNLIGNPAGLYKNIGSGVQDFFYEPYTGLMSSPTDFLVGLGKGTKGLFTGVAGGVVNSAANIVGSATGGVSTVAKGVASITGDEKYLKRREEKRRELKASQGGVLEGFMAGGESLVSGFSSGISGLVTKPYEEGQKAGAVGFFKGLGQGLVGVAVKPVIGISEGISSVVQGINQQISDTSAMQHLRPSRAFYRRDHQDDSCILVPLDFFAAEAQKFIRERAIRKDYQDSFLCSIYLGFNSQTMNDESSLGFVLSDRLFVLLSRQFREKWSVPVPSISYFQLIRDENKNYGVKVIIYESSGNTSQRYFAFANRKSAIDGYDTLFRFRNLFGKATEMIPSEQALQEMESGSGSSPPPDERPFKITHYEFGTANKIPVKIEKMENVSDSEFNRRYNFMLKQFQISLPALPEDEYGYHKLLDDILWRIISNWAKNHDYILNPSRCCGCLVLNYSTTEIQILESQLAEGVDIATFGVGAGYDPNARSLKPFGGAAIIFATGRRPTILNLEHVKIVLKTTAFKAMVATRENRSTCEPIAGFTAQFLEKSRTDWWAKYVICIK